MLMAANERAEATEVDRQITVKNVEIFCRCSLTSNKCTLVKVGV